MHVCVYKREGRHMVAILVRPSLELWFSGAPLTSIIHVLECLIATQSMFGYRQVLILASLD